MSQKEFETESLDGSQFDDEATHEKEDTSEDTSQSTHDDDESSSAKKRKNTPQILEIEAWDPTEYDTRDFFPTHENDYNAAGTSKDGIDQSTYTRTEGNVEYLSKLENTPSPPFPRKTVLDDGKDSGFLTCTNPNKTPKCDHLFTIYPKAGDTDGEVRKARMCHGYIFRGKLCRNAKKKGGNFKRRDAPCDSAKCPYAHIDSFDQLREPHDILSLLYYVDNNDDVDFIPGIGCTPQEYMQRHRAAEGISSTYRTRPSNQIVDPSSQRPMEVVVRELRANLSAVRQELSATQEQLRKSERERFSLLQRHTTYGQSERTITNMTLKDAKDTTIRYLQEEVCRLRNGLQDTYHRWEASTLVAENTKSDYAVLKQKYQQHLDEEGKFHTSTELLQLEVVQLKGELKQSRAENQKLVRHRQETEHSESSTNITQQDEPWPDLVQFDKFLERSIPTLMQMTDGKTDGKTDEQIHLNLLSKVPPQQNLDRQPSSRILDLSALERTPSSRLLDASSSSVLLDVSALERKPSSSLIEVPALKGTLSRQGSYKSIGDGSSVQPNGVKSPTMGRNETFRVTDEESLRSEISYLVSCYGNQVSVVHGEAVAVTRFLKLPMSLYNGRDIDVALVLTLPEGYPWNGNIKVHSDPRLTNHFGADSQYRKIVSESIAGLLNICRWEAEARQGTPHVLMSIMKAAERWVHNDWKIIQKKNVAPLPAADHDSSQEDSHSSSL